jgi:uncharacterized protein
MDSGWYTFAVAALAAGFVGLSKGGLPVVGTLGVPVLALSMSPVRAAAVLLPIYVLSDVFGLWAYRRHFDRRNIEILVPAAALGILIGWLTASRVSEAHVSLLVGLIGVAFCVNAWCRHKQVAAARPADLPRGMFWGTLTGFTSFVSHSGGPTYQMYVLPQRLDKMTFAGTATIFFAIVNALKLLPYWQLGQLSVGNLELAGLVAPFAVGAVFGGVWLTRRIHDRWFFRVVYLALFLVSVRLVWGARDVLLGTLSRAA